ncbi:hypothetical protein ACFW35_18120 [Fictibacillus sp. NPDC058756]
MKIMVIAGSPTAKSRTRGIAQYAAHPEAEINHFQKHTNTVFL